MGRRKSRARQNHIHLGKGAEFVAFCRYHKKPMTKNQVKAKRCKEKSCIHIRPYIDPYEAAIIRAKRKESDEKCMIK